MPQYARCSRFGKVFVGGVRAPAADDLLSRDTKAVSTVRAWNIEAGPVKKGG